MQMRKILCSSSLEIDLAHVKYGVWTGHKGDCLMHLSDVLNNCQMKLQNIEIASLTMFQEKQTYLHIH